MPLVLKAADTRFLYCVDLTDCLTLPVKLETGNAFPLEVSPSDSEVQEILLQKFISKSTVYSKLVQRKGELQTKLHKFLPSL